MANGTAVDQPITPQISLTTYGITQSCVKGGKKWTEDNNISFWLHGINKTYQLGRSNNQDRMKYELST